MQITMTKGIDTATVEPSTGDRWLVRYTSRTGTDTIVHGRNAGTLLEALRQSGYYMGAAQAAAVLAEFGATK